MFEVFISILIVVLAGWISGLLVNYFGDILPSKRGIRKPICVYCENPMPMVDYLVSPRKCMNCGRRRAERTWIVEIIFIVVSLWLWFNPPTQLGYGISLCLVIYFGIVTIIDIEHRLILHITSLVGAFLGFGVGVYLHGLKSTLLGGLAGFCGMLLLYLLGFGFMKLMSRWRGQVIEEEALGFGDVNLCGVIGLILGWPGIIAGVILAILLAGFSSLIYILVMLVVKRYRPNMALPYGPFLVAATIFLLFFKGTLAG